MRSAHWSSAALVLAAVVWTAPALAAELQEISFGRYSDTGEMFDLAKQSPVTMSADKRSVIGLLIVGGQPDTMMLCYEKMEGGILGLVGTAEIAYAEGSSLAELKKVPAAKWKEILANTKVMPQGEWKKLREDKPDAKAPRNAVQLAPNVQAVPLVDRPGDFLICKAKDKLYLLEIVAHEKEKTAKLKIYPLP